VFAAAHTWDGGGGSLSWGTGTNWNPDGAVFNDTTDLTFGASGSQTYTGVGTAGGTRTVRSLTFNDGFTSSTGRIRFNSGGASGSGNINHLIFNSTSGTANIILTSGMTGAVDLGAGGSSVFGDARLTSNLTITNHSSVGSLTITSNITETTAGRSITKEGVGLITLNRPCSHTGPTTINAGTLRGNLTGDCANSELILNNAAATFMVGVGGTTADWTCKDLTTAAAGTLQFNFSVNPGTTLSPLVVTNLANFTATPNVSVLVNSVPASGTYPLMTWGSVSGTPPTTANLTLSKFELGKSAELQISGNTLNLVVTTVAPSIVKDNNSNDLGVGTSWVGGSAPASSQAAKWNSVVTAPNTTVLGSDVSWGGIIIEDPAGPVSIGSGNTLTLGLGGIDLSLATADLTMNCGLVLAANQTWNVTAGRTLALNGIVSGPYGITKQGAGTTSLGANHTWSGDTTVSAGSLKLAASNTIPDGSGTGNVSINGKLDLGGFNEGINGLSGTGSVDNTAASSTSTLTLGGNNQTATFSGVIEDSGPSAILHLAKTGTGTQILSGVNTYSGTTTVSTGALRVTDPSALGTTDGGTLVNGGTAGTNVARLELSGGITVTGEAINIKGGGNFVGALSSFSGINTWAGNITVGAAATRIGATSGATLKVSGVIDSGTSTHGLTIRTGDLNSPTILSGANTYLGDTTITVGKLQLEGGDNRLPVTTRIIMGGGANATEFDLNGTHQEVAGIALGTSPTATNTINNSAVAPSTLTVNTNTPSSFAGVIKGELALTKKGTESLTLFGANTYTGTTTVTAGTLALVGGSQASPITISTGASLGFTLGSPTISSSSVNLTNGTVKITGSVDDVSSYTLITAAGGITGTPTLDSTIPKYTLQVQDSGTKLVLVYTGAASGYSSWSGGAAADLDSNHDGVTNGIAWALGAADPNTNAIQLLPTIDHTSDPNYLLFSFNRSDLANVDPNTSIAVQYGTTPNGWTTAVHDGDNVIVQVTDGSPNDAVVVKLKRSSLAPSGRIFTRLNVTVTP